MSKIIKNRYLIALVILAVFNFSFFGCYSTKEISIDDMDKVKVLKILLNNGTEIDFTKDKFGYAYLSNDEIVIFKTSGEQEIFPLSTIKKIYTDKFNTVKTFLLGLGIVVAVFALLVAPALGGIGG